MKLFVVSGYSLGDYISTNGWRKAARLVFKDPRLSWQMLGSGLMRLATGSRNIHVLIESGGLVLDRQFRSDVITTSETVFLRPDIEGYVDIPVTGPLVSPKPGPRSSGVLKITFGYLVLYSTQGSRRWGIPKDCITTAKWYLGRAGITVPDSVWTADLLLEFLENLGYPFIPYRNK